MVIKIDSFVSTGVGKLEKRLMGGVTLESAQKAISETASAVAEEMDKVSKTAVEQVNTENIKAMQKLEDNYLAQLAQKDKEMLSLSTSKSEVEAEKQSILTKLEKLIARVENARTYKEIDTLSDRSKVFEKINLNGVRATKIVNKDGKVTQINIVKGKMFRRTKYNPETGKPISRITNATKDGKPIEILFDDYGNIKKINPLNVKKVKPEPPKVVDRRIVENNEYHVVTESKLSDGSILTAKVERSNGQVYYWDKRNSEHSYPTEWYDRDRMSGIIRRGSKNKTVTTYPNGIKYIYAYSKTTDEVTGLRITTSRINFPKGSSIKRIDIKTMEGSSNPFMHIVTLRNGEKIELTDFKYEDINPNLTARRIENKILVPQKAVKIAKNGATSEMPHDEIRPWIESFHPEYNDSIYTKIY